MYADLKDDDAFQLVWDIASSAEEDITTIAGRFICCQSQSEFPAVEAKSRATRSCEVLVLAKAPMRVADCCVGRPTPTNLIWFEPTERGCTYVRSVL